MSTTPYATNPLKPGDKVSIRSYSDINAGTVIKATATTAVVRMHSAKLRNGVNSGEPDALHFSPGGFVGHTEGIQRWEVDPTSNDGERKISFRKGDRINDVIGVWRESGVSGGIGKLSGIVYVGWHVHYDFNF